MGHNPQRLELKRLLSTLSEISSVVDIVTLALLKPKDVELKQANLNQEPAVGEPAKEQAI